MDFMVAALITIVLIFAAITIVFFIQAQKQRKILEAKLEENDFRIKMTKGELSKLLDDISKKCVGELCIDADSNVYLQLDSDTIFQLKDGSIITLMVSRPESLQ